MADQLLLFLAWSGAALLLVGTTVLMAGIGFHIESRWREKIAEWLVPTLIVAMIASTLFSSRDLSPLLLDYSSPRKGIGQVGENILRILTVIVVGFAFLQMIGIRFARQRLMGNQGIMIFGAFAAYLLSNSIVNSILGTRPSFDASFLYSLILVAALFCARHVVRIDALAKAAMASILVALILSLVLAILDPKLAFETHYTGWVPGLDGRLWGVGSNPNSIAPLALTYLILNYKYSWRSVLFRWIGVVAAILVLIFAQSKTTWLCAGVSVAIVAWYRRPRENEKINATRVLAILGILAALCLCVLIIENSQVTRNQSFLTADLATGLTTLSGRSAIWDVALEEWQRSPVFGYGMTIWSEAYRRQIGMSYAFSAHNQFLQSLSSAGIVGLVGLIYYIGVLLVYSAQRAKRSKGITMALFFFIVLRCMTETPLDVSGIISAEFIIHLILLQTLLFQDYSSSREGSKERYTGARGVGLAPYV